MFVIIYFDCSIALPILTNTYYNNYLVKLNMCYYINQHSCYSVGKTLLDFVTQSKTSFMVIYT